MEWTYDDLITGERFQALAQVTVLTRPIFEFHRSLPQSGVREIVGFRGSMTELEPDSDSLERLRGRRSIFVYSHLLDSFLARVLPRLEHPFVLISHNSDHGVGPQLARALEDERIIHWFAQNAVISHPKLTPLPIGVANAQWPHGNLAALLAAANKPRPSRRDDVYLNFDVRTNPAVRVPLMRRLETSALTWRAPARPFPTYLEDMASCRWVVSPPGNGVDCHRTWEALYLGTTPIVSASPSGAALHNALPVIQLDDLGALDRSVLEEAGRRLSEQKAHWERLTMAYWRRLIESRVNTAD